MKFEYKHTRCLDKMVGGQMDHEMSSCQPLPVHTYRHTRGRDSVADSSHTARVVNTASKLIGNNKKQLSSIYKDALKRKSTQILYDPAHPLNQAFQKLPSGRRLKVPLAKKNIFKKSFVPSAILILNAK